MHNREVEEMLRRYRPAAPRPELRTVVMKTGDSGVATGSRNKRGLTS